MIIFTAFMRLSVRKEGLRFEQEADRKSMGAGKQDGQTASGEVPQHQCAVWPRCPRCQELSCFITTLWSGLLRADQSCMWWEPESCLIKAILDLPMSGLTLPASEHGGPCDAYTFPSFRTSLKRNPINHFINYTFSSLQSIVLIAVFIGKRHGP